MVLARDQWGQELTIPGRHPRKELLDKLGYKHAERLYVDKNDGRRVHVGYEIGRSWYTLYTIEPWEKDVNA